MPEDINIENYLVSLTSIASKNGFSIRRLVPLEGGSNNDLTVQVSVDGYGNVTDLIRDIEGLKRVTKIIVVDINRVKGRERIELQLQIFSR